MAIWKDRILTWISFYRSLFGLAFLGFAEEIWTFYEGLFDARLIDAWNRMELLGMC
jgi:hypothetical protein